MLQSSKTPLCSDLLLQQEKCIEMFLENNAEVFKTLSNEQQQDFKRAIALSDFVFESAMQDPMLVCQLFASQSVYDAEPVDYRSLLSKKIESCHTEDELHRCLRLFRLEHMVKIAVADMVFGISLDKSLSRQSSLADCLILEALSWLTYFCEEKWGTPVSSDGEEQKLLVFGMGKLGGNELNFSSDIDLIFSYPQMGETQGVRRTLDNQQFFTRLAQKLIAALHQKTANGFVYRVDMRLRPFGESGPLVLSFSAMEDYYQEQGRDWERYAMLKARVIGDGDFHQQLSAMLRPFVYRRYIDFSVIDSLRKMKMMISQEVRRKQLTNNIKLGAGGIREVEFIVQVFQLIRGGRVKELQRRNLLTVLPLLEQHQVLPTSSAQVLESAYRFLRRTENIIQAIGDKQTQTLPESELDKIRLLHVLNFKTWEEFIEALAVHMNNVHQEFIQLIGEETPNNQDVNEKWITLWLSRWDDEESKQWLADIAPTWPSDKTWLQISEFRQDIERRSIGIRGRQVLEKLMPTLLSHLNQLTTSDSALCAILAILKKISTRTAYLELLYENQGALVHLIKLCNKSEWVAEHISKYPILLDELIDPKLLHNPPQLESYSTELQQLMLRIPEEDVEMQMETLRQFKQAQHLRVAAADIVGVLPVTKVSDHLTAIAECIVSEVIQLAWNQVEKRFGIPASLSDKNHKGFSVVGYGKMGGIELGYGSDLDLVFLHDCDPLELTNGERQVPASQFYGKLAQKILHIFNTRMTSGILYELDMRLRPSGNSGILVIHVDTFYQYQNEEAWTWEHQALVRARTIYGHKALIDKFDDYRRQILSRSRESIELKESVNKMREKMKAHLDTTNEDFANIKHGSGGLVDIEFLAQFLVLNYAHEFNEITSFSDNIRIFEQLKKYRIIDEKQMLALIDCYCQLRDFGHKATLKNQSAQINADDFNIITQEAKQICQYFMT